MKNTFKKSERLTSKTIMENVFANGSMLKKYPFLIKYLPYNFEDGNTVKIVITVPKRRIKKATVRNRIRRQIKEVYRLNKADLLQVIKQSESGLALFLIYTGKEKPDYSVIEVKLKLLLKELSKKCALLKESNTK